MLKASNFAAALDIGSNSFRMLIAKTDGQNIQPIYTKRIIVRLSSGLLPSRLLQDNAIKRGWLALQEFSDILRQYRPIVIKICGTAALRQATNSCDFTDKACEIIGHPIEIISGEYEAYLTLIGVISTLPSPSIFPRMVIDVGGGSTEIIVPSSASSESAESAQHAISLPVGAVNMSERFFDQPGDSDLSRKILEQYLDVIFAESNDKLALMKNKPDSFDMPTAANECIATGGTATSLAAIDLNLKEYHDDLVQNRRLSKQTIEGLISKLNSLQPQARNSLVGMENGRGDIIVAGTIIYQKIMDALQLRELTVSTSGLLEGILLCSVK